MSKFRIRAWTTSYGRTVYTAEVKSLFFWNKIEHNDCRAGALDSIETFKRNKSKEGVEYVG